MEPIEFAKADVNGITFVSVRKNVGRKRSADQIAMDKEVQDAYGADFTALYVKRNEVEMAKKLARKSSEHLDLGVSFGRTIDTADQDIVILTFKVRDRIRRPRKTIAE